MPENDRLQSLFERALELSPAERLPFLQGECGNDRGLIDEVVELLAADTARRAERVLAAHCD